MKTHAERVLEVGKNDQKITPKFIAEQNAEVIARLLSRQGDESQAKNWVDAMNRQVNQATDAYYYVKQNFPESNIKMYADVFAPLAALEMASEMLKCLLRKPTEMQPYYHFYEKVGDLLITFRTADYIISTTFESQS